MQQPKAKPRKYSDPQINVEEQKPWCNCCSCYFIVAGGLFRWCLLAGGGFEERGAAGLFSRGERNYRCLGWTEFSGVLCLLKWVRAAGKIG